MYPVLDKESTREHDPHREHEKRECHTRECKRLGPVHGTESNENDGPEHHNGVNGGDARHIRVEPAESPPEAENPCI